MKLKEAERAKDADDRLAHNMSNIGVISVDMGLDDRTNVLHDGRFLPGANCSAVKLWLAARERTPLHGAPPLGNYDMACVGLGGFVSSRGWVELANPASTRLSLKHFNINSCARRVSSKKSDSEDSGLQEITELGEFQLALRTLRTAAAFVMPWNFSFTALENFIINSRYCKADLGEIDNKAQILSQFCDYVLAENASNCATRSLSYLQESSKTRGTRSFPLARSPPSRKKRRLSSRPFHLRRSSTGPTWASRSCRSLTSAITGTRVRATTRRGRVSLHAVFRSATCAITARTPATCLCTAGRTTGGW
jgi:hypothetical protein